MDAFVYGTLTDSGRVAQVLSEFEFRGEALLDGLHRVEGEYPTLAPGGTVTGRILRTPEVEKLDAYEGVHRGLYVRESVPCVDDGSQDEGDSDSQDVEQRNVEVYVGNPDALDAEAEWPGTGAFSERVRRFLRENDIVVRPNEST